MERLLVEPGIHVASALSPRDNDEKPLRAYPSAPRDRIVRLQPIEMTAMQHSRCLSPLALLAALTAGLTAGAANAAEWVAEPSVNLRGQYDDNFRLTNDPHDSVWGTILDPRLKLSRRSELWELSATGRVRGAHYTGQDGLNTVDNFFDLAAERSLERGSLTASGSLINDTTLQNEYLDFDTGLTVRQIDRTRQTARLSGEYKFTEATWVEASANYNTVEYEDASNSGLSDYTYWTPSVQVVHQLDEQWQVFGVLSRTASDYDLSAPQSSESTTDSLSLGGSYDLTETWNITASVGNRRTETDSEILRYAVPDNVIPDCQDDGGINLGGGIIIPCPIILEAIHSESTGLVYDASLTREFETGSLRLSGSQSVMPSSNATDYESTRISLDGTYRFSAKLSAALAVSYYQSTTVEETTGSSETNRYRISPSLAWNLDRSLVLNTGYIYTQVERGGGGDNTVDNNAVFVGLGYSWPRMAISR